MMSATAISQRLDPAEETIVAIAGDGSFLPVCKLDAHYRGQKHLAVSVFVFAGARLLVQRRASGKYHSGGQWANSCCTHPNWAEAPAACARRRLLEELGFTLPLSARNVVDYRADVGNGMIENERVHIFEAHVSPAAAAGGAAALPLDRFDPAEVQAVAWLDRDELHAAIAADPQSFTPWFRIYLDRWSELGLQAA
ncbi:NUDIX domain-containing protein [Aquibium sp. ELW1220]|jgi:isopentenyl-diphosphate delta-isomerase|uniref:isopentenyl-diphosphate Delta-isomerase n=1 Tax=Aquibium sp. ELW1220 TaxID=2976766 RepID=UPI0025B122FC|nr:NUDIX domain-containing protein [Aquibium sp. ELW1220]MDN2581086.1 NUDIX domain-containing protein [Aquibium sp. ELW1220]